MIESRAPVDFRAEFPGAMSAHLTALEAIASNPAVPTFENTIRAFDEAGRGFQDVYQDFRRAVSLTRAAPWIALAREFARPLVEHAQAIYGNAQLAARVAHLHATREDEAPTLAALMQIERLQIDFQRAGDGAEIKRVSEMTAHFTQHCREDETNLTTTVGGRAISISRSQLAPYLSFSANPLRVAPLITISDIDAAKATRILIINVTRIGDTLMTTPAIRAIHEKFPNAAITVLGHAKRVEVLENLPFITKVGNISKRSAPFRARLGPLTGARYDYAFVWGNDRALHEYALRKAQRVIAYRTDDAALNARFFCATEPPPLFSLHGVEMLLSLPRAVGIDTQELRLNYAVTAAEREAARARLARDIPPNAAPILGFQVASFATKAWRNWPIEHFIELAQGILATHPAAHFVLFGSKDDRDTINKFTAAHPKHSVSYAGELTLRETGAVMNEIDAYVGVDTGPTHLFGALGKPMVVMYHPSLPSGLYRPLGHGELRTVEHPLIDCTVGSRLDGLRISVASVQTAAESAIHACAPRSRGSIMA